MRDKVSVSRVQLLHPKIREEVKTLIEAAESKFPTWIGVRIVQGLRTIEEQDGLYALGRTKVNPDGKSAKKPLGNIVTNARGGSSNHNYGLAIDFALLIDKDKNGTWDEVSWSLVQDLDKDGKKDWMEVVDTFKAAGYQWGGDWSSFKDYPHLEKVFGLSITQLKAKVQKKDYIPGTKYVNI